MAGISATGIAQQQARVVLATLADLATQLQAPVLNPVDAHRTMSSLQDGVTLLHQRVVEALRPEPEVAPPPALKLTSDQQRAWVKLVKWLSGKAPYFILRGYAGTGKTFLMRKLRELPYVFYYTSPTNKASKVLSLSVGLPTRTTYAQLGLKMVQQDDQLVLEAASDRPRLEAGAILVIDEGSMAGSQLRDAVVEAVTEQGIRVLIVGDPAQLPPVGEARSPCWRLTLDKAHRSLLTQVMRNGSCLLDVATRLRQSIVDKEYPGHPLNTELDDQQQGVHCVPDVHRFISRLLKGRNTPQAFDQVKVLAWRNRAVDHYNRRVRDHLGFDEPYVVGERILLGAPIVEAEVIIAHTDEEMEVTEVGNADVKVPGAEISSWVLQCRSLSSSKVHGLFVPMEQRDLDIVLERLASEARNAKGRGRFGAWRTFWATKQRFHTVRYGYAMTVHRAQGSTYEQVFIDQQDILANQNRREAYQCLYVAATRPTINIVTY